MFERSNALFSTSFRGAAEKSFFATGFPIGVTTVARKCPRVRTTAKKVIDVNGEKRSEVYICVYMNYLMSVNRLSYTYEGLFSHGVYI